MCGDIFQVVRTLFPLGFTTSRKSFKGIKRVKFRSSYSLALYLYSTSKCADNLLAVLVGCLQRLLGEKNSTAFYLLAFPLEQ